MNKYRFAFMAALILLWPLSVLAADPGMTVEQFESSLHYQTGTVNLPGGKVRLEIPKTFRYLGPNDARRVLEDAWGNPPGGTTLGMLFPANVSPVERDAWGIIITYSDDGHVSDDDADSIDYTDLLAQMKDDIAEENKMRSEKGFETAELVGWAQEPRYDKETRKFYWAKDIRFASDAQDTLNYNIRILGRDGVLVLNAVAGMDQLYQIDQAIPDILAFTNFTSGNKYEDFDASTDKVAAYGLAALVAGVAAKKLGLLAVIVAFLVKGWKLLLVGAAALGGGFMKSKKNRA